MSERIRFTIVQRDDKFDELENSQVNPSCPKCMFTIVVQNDKVREVKEFANELLVSENSMFTVVARDDKVGE